MKSRVIWKHYLRCLAFFSYEEILPFRPVFLNWFAWAPSKCNGLTFTIILWKLRSFWLQFVNRSYIYRSFSKISRSKCADTFFSDGCVPRIKKSWEPLLYTLELSLVFVKIWADFLRYKKNSVRYYLIFFLNLALSFGTTEPFSVFNNSSFLKL